MKYIVKSILIVYTLVFLTACNKKENSEEKYTITGQVTGFPDGTKFYLRNLATDADFDSTIVENNKFKFEGHLYSPPEQIWLRAIVDNKSVYTNLFIGNDDIKIKGDILDFPWNVDIKGSKTQEDFKYSQNITKDYNIKRDSLVQSFFKLTQNQQQELGGKIWKEIGKIDSLTTNLRIAYIKSHPDTYTSLIELGYLKNQLSKDTIHKIFNRYIPEIKKSKYAKVIEVFLRENILNIGDQYQDFKGINQREENMKLSYIKKDNYVLLDFTSAYCGPCMQAADELLEINKNYSDSLIIVSVSQDNNKEDWLKSLKRDKVTWNSIWDGEGIYSETSIKYGIQGFPTFVLINPKGTIIDKWPGYGKGSIVNRLEKNLSKK